MNLDTVGERIDHLLTVGDTNAAAVDLCARLPSGRCLADGHTAQIVRGRVDVPNGATLAAIAEVLGASVDWLLTGAGREPSARSVRAAVEAAHDRDKARPAPNSKARRRKSGASRRRTRRAAR